MQDAPVEVDTPHGTVPITGTVDRIDMTEGTEASELVVRDYKTGTNLPSEGATLDGFRLQLPLYALMAESVLESRTDRPVDTVGGAYYQVSPPVSVSHNAGQIGSRERAQHAYWGDGDEPLMAWRYPRFDTHAGFREFIETAVLDRLGQIAAGIEAGSFHPTVLDPDDAGCEYCGYQHVCDVRPHQRHDVRTHLERPDVDIPSYIPPSAAGRSYEPTTVEDGGDL
jgi:ATP-dependent helicase/nuclease subunit B